MKMGPYNVGNEPLQYMRLGVEWQEEVQEELELEYDFYSQIAMLLYKMTPTTKKA